ncbi:MAG: glutamine-hydrolyzing carbamoyl-phosphate synthase small subunit [FCB group bacterium]|nr:glutamine-hydrolyzing carbamoyl-phosphate synthase small subunit [FCB group bacterium]
MLEDGRIFSGWSLGNPDDALGELCFNTGLTGYQEILTDPSYAGQIITFTAPHIGNYGTNDDDREAERIQAAGLVIHSLSPLASNWRSRSSLEEYLKRQQVTGITGVDTRALTRHLRQNGARNGFITTREATAAGLIKKVRDWPAMTGRDLTAQVTCATPWEWPASGTESYRVVVLDFGIKWSTLKILSSRGCRLTLVPATTSAEDVLARSPDGVLLSNGPGDPAACDQAIRTAKKLLGRVPILGICLGHQILNLASGAKTFKLKFGHRGSNHPVQNLRSGRIEITSQNHGFAVDAEHLPPSLEITHRNLNDNTVEGTRWKDAPAFSVQYHPEGGPGPSDSRYIFDAFLTLMDRYR